MHTHTRAHLLVLNFASSTQWTIFKGWTKWNTWKFSFSRNVRKYHGRPEPLRRAAPGAGHITAAWGVADQQIYNLAPACGFPHHWSFVQSDSASCCSACPAPPPPSPLFADSRLLVEQLCIAISSSTIRVTITYIYLMHSRAPPYLDLLLS